MKNEAQSVMERAGSAVGGGAPVFDPAAVTHSVLAADGVLEHVAATYPVERPLRCDLLQSGSNETYLLTGARRSWVARVYGRGWRSAAEVAYELALLEHLGRAGVAIAGPLPDRDGELLQEVVAPEGARVLVLFAYISGTRCSLRNVEHAHRAGRAVARLHEATTGFATPHPRFRLDGQRLIEAALAQMEPLLAPRLEARRYLVRLAATLRDRLAAFADRGLDWGVCHGDIRGKNLFLLANGDCAMIDFDLCGPGWRAFDLAPAHRIAWYQRQPAIWEAFARGYAEAHPLAAIDREAVPLFHGIKQFWSLGMRAVLARRHGTATLDAQLESHLAFFRGWEAGNA